MYDGYRIDEHWQMVETQSTRVHLQEWDPGMPWVRDDGSFTEIDVDVPDSNVGPVPFESRFEALPCRHLTAATPVGRLKQTAYGTLKVLKAIPTGFVVQSDLTCDGANLRRTAVLRSVGTRRKGTWPYSRLRAGESWEEKFVQVVKDAWNGAC